MKEYRAIGLMSGTSLDGIDAALLLTDGESRIAREGFVTLPYAPALRAKIRACLGQVREKAGEAEHDLTVAHAEIVKLLLEKTGAAAEDIDLIGFHGQTIGHDPARGYTCQIGDGSLLARLTGISVVNDFRTRDVEAGGQGAPLVPVYHQALAAGLERPLAFLNIGGVANVTYVDDKNLIAFDTGPGNALLDDWMLHKTGRACDENGAAARAGRVDEAVLAGLLSHPYFAAPAPKSLDRDAFASRAWKGLTTEDGAATLAAFTVRAVARGLALLPERPLRWIVCGGGRRNAMFMESLKDALGAPVVPIEDIGLDGDATEAEAFAYLAVRSLRGLPLSFPSTTGVSRPMTGGALHRAAGRAA